MPTTSSPRDASIDISFEPMKPAAPVTSIFIFLWLLLSSGRTTCGAKPGDRRLPAPHLEVFGNLFRNGMLDGLSVQGFVDGAQAFGDGIPVVFAHVIWNSDKRGVDRPL